MKRNLEEESNRVHRLQINTSASINLGYPRNTASDMKFVRLPAKYISKDYRLAGF
jgi:hypothetical protein